MKQTDLALKKLKNLAYGSNPAEWKILPVTEGKAVSEKEILRLARGSKDVFTLLVYQEFPCPRAFSNKKLFKSRKETEPSSLDLRLQDILFQNPKQTNDEIDKIVQARYGISKSHRKYYEYFDLEFAKHKRSLRSKVLKELLWDAAAEYIDENKLKQRRLLRSDSLTDERYAEILDSFLSNFPRVKHALKKKITRRDRVTKYTRTFKNQLPRNIAWLLEGELGWCQLYFFRDKSGRLFFAKGSSSGSWTRESHGYFGHLFCELKSQGIPVSTFIARFNKNGRMTLEGSSQLFLHQNELTGNFRINSEISKRTLKHAQLQSDPYSLFSCRR